jgi:hypothetical protein
VKQTNKAKKLLLEIERIKVLDSRRMGEVAGGGVTYLCGRGTNNTTGRGALGP